MDRKNIVEKFLEKGRLLTPDALALLEDYDIEFFLSQQYDNLVLGEEYLKIVMPAESIKILKNLTDVPREITKSDFVNFYSTKYEKMKNIIIERLKKDFVSLDKIGANRDEVYTIGMVRDIKDGDKTTILLEDLTASKPAVFSEKISNIEPDDVVAVKAVSGGDILFGKSITFPDIPIRTPEKGTGKACFISDLHLDESPKKDAEKFFQWFEMQDIKHLFVAGDVCDRKLFDELISRYCSQKKIFVVPGHRKETEYPTPAEQYDSQNIIALSNPSIVELNGMKILIIHECSIEMIQKRYLGKSRRILKDDYLVLDIVPDIIHCGHTHEAQIMNYKAVTFVNSGSLLTTLRPVVVDFATREAMHVEM